MKRRKTVEKERPMMTSETRKASSTGMKKRLPLAYQKRNVMSAITASVLLKTLTRNGAPPARSAAMNGRMMKSAIRAERASAVETTIGIGLMNSPMMPDARRSGRNAQTVVMVVVRMTIR